MNTDIWRDLAEEIARGVWTTHMCKDFDEVVDEIEERIKKFAKERIVRVIFMVSK